MGAGQALRELLGGIVDYAGLFPPAGLDMSAAAAEFERCRRDENAWMLARFVVPAARVSELDAAEVDSSDWPLSVLLAEEPGSTFERLDDTRATSVELKAEDIVAVSAQLPPQLECFFELDPSAELHAQLQAVATVGRFAKIRTGGIVADAIPAAEVVAEFLIRCHEHRVPFKATAGLHHPIRSDHALHYGDDAPRDTMHGFLNVFLAAAMLTSGGASDEQLVRVLEDRDVRAFACADDEIRWRDHRFGPDQLTAARRFARSFGSCSFAEPLDDLRRLQWL